MVDAPRRARATYSVVVADDHALMRAALVEVLGSHPQLRIVAVAADADEAISYSSAHQPDIVVLDVAMPGGGGGRAAREIREAQPSTSVVVLTAYTDEATRRAMEDAGAIAVLHKGTTEDIAEVLVQLRTASLR